VSGRRRPLAWHLGLLLGIAVLAVLLVVGVVVNRVLSSSFRTVVTGQQEQRLDDAAVTLGDRWDRPARLQALVRRVATNLGGQLTVTAADGTTVGSFGRPAGGDVATYETPISVDGAIVGTLSAELPATATDRGFLPLFNATLVIAGLISLALIVAASTLIADRLTRPLRDVAGAARRLERGESGARATGGGDAESAGLAHAFNAMADRLERSEMLRRRAASDLAHDLATPTTLLESQLQAMVDGVIPTDRATLDAARATAQSLGGLVADLGDLAEAEAAELHVRPTAVPVEPAIGAAVRALEALARDRGVAISVAASRVVAWVDPGHVARALQNVIANAVVHSPTGSTVAVTASGDDRAVTIRVADVGPGIDPADLPHVFERFYRADTARTMAAELEPHDATRGAGHGLGLTIARELLSASGGTIEVAATGPAGTTFRIMLPAAGPARPAGRTPDPADPAVRR